MEPTPRLRVGCAMWANRAWVGRTLPRALASGDELGAYARLCTAVEGNTTFYAVPPASSVRRWDEQAPPEFRFVCKLPRTITHDQRLREAGDLVREFCERLAPLGDRLGPISVQLPPSLGPDEFDVLERFLRALPRDFPWGVEPRHPDFAATGAAEVALDTLLRDLGFDRIIIDTRAVFAGPRETPAEIEAFERKPRLKIRPVATAGQPVVRFIGQTDPEANPEFWAPWVDHVVRWLDDGCDPIVFLHTPDNVDAPLLARRFHDEVRAHVPTLPPLPEPLPIDPQLDLFP
ncbi:DUF72 domain-containing protein [Actinospongicola halichondriae]|uniref:DUF72 domain-containing protein n=1 Tax=Actinospongicola halichondriae TaxID=3236844 RepID=UPI003D370346